MSFLFSRLEGAAHLFGEGDGHFYTKTLAKPCMACVFRNKKRTFRRRSLDQNPESESTNISQLTRVAFRLVCGVAAVVECVALVAVSAETLDAVGAFALVTFEL